MTETFFGKMLFVFELFPFTHVSTCHMEMVRFMTGATVSDQGPSTKTRCFNWYNVKGKKKKVSRDLVSHFSYIVIHLPISHRNWQPCVTSTNTSVTAYLLIATLAVKCCSFDIWGVSRQEAAVFIAWQVKFVPLTHLNTVLAKSSELVQRKYLHDWAA